jgi:hypothetical protein
MTKYFLLTANPLTLEEWGTWEPASRAGYEELASHHPELVLIAADNLRVIAMNTVPSELEKAPRSPSTEPCNPTHPSAGA